MKNSIALIAFLFGILAVGMAAFQTNLVQNVPKNETTESKRTLKEAASDAAKKLIEEKVLREKQAPKPVADASPTPLHPYQIAINGLGIVAIGLGAFAWAQKAQPRLAASAIGLGLIAIAWKWVLIAVGVAIVLLFLSNLG
jgi:hypothetical protein